MREIIEKRHLLSTNISMGVCSFAVVFALEFLSVLREMGDNHQSCHKLEVLSVCSRVYVPRLLF